jgi:ankyrin repeat protein
MLPPSVRIWPHVLFVSFARSHVPVPSLGLHSAAATGNLGLVEYALVHGQPVNSVLDGVLPLHAACAGGHVQVVRLLIEWGADVNAPRYV